MGLQMVRAAFFALTAFSLGRPTARRYLEEEADRAAAEAAAS
jgi:hypothetical protein